MKERTYIISKQQQYVQSVDLKAGRYTINYSIRTPNTSHRFAFLKKSGGWQEFEMQNLTPGKWHRKDEAKLSFYLLEDVVAFNLCTSPVSVSSPVMIQRLMLEEGMNASTAKPNELDLLESIEDLFDMEHIFKPKKNLVQPETPESLQQDDYTPEGWDDDPMTATKDFPYVWHSFRQRIGDVWGAFYPPTLYSSYSKDGEDVKMIEIRGGTSLKNPDKPGGVSSTTLTVVKHGFESSIKWEWLYQGSWQATTWTGDITINYNEDSGLFVNDVATLRCVSTVNPEVFTVVSITAIWDGEDGEENVSVILSNESHLFAGTEDYAIATTLPVYIYAFRGTTQITLSVDDITIGTLPLGLTAKKYFDGVVFTVSSTPPFMVSPSGVVPITVKIDGQNYVRNFSYAISFKGPAGITKDVRLEASTQIIRKLKDGTWNPSTPVTVTATAVNTTITTWEYSVNGGTFSTTPPIGVTRSGNVVSINPNAAIAYTPYTIRASDGAISDTLSVIRLEDGATGESAVTLVLSNESHTFAGSATAALDGSTNTTILAFKGTQQIAPTSVTVNTSDLPTGMTRTINGSVITFTVTTSMTSSSGVIPITVVIDGKTFTLQFSYAIAFKGTGGKDGASTEWGYLLNNIASTPGKPTGSLPSGGWSYTMGSISASNQYLWISSRTKPAGSTVWGAWSNAALHARWSKDGDIGLPGIPGQVPVQKEWVADDRHRNSDEIVDYIYVRGSNSETSYWYQLIDKTDTKGIIAGAAPTGGAIPAGYKAVSWMKTLAVKTLIAEEANLANFIFKEGKLLSVGGTTFAGEEINYGEYTEYNFANTVSQPAVESSSWTVLPSGTLRWVRYKKNTGSSWTVKQAGTDTGQWKMQFATAPEGETWYSSYSINRFWARAQVGGEGNYGSPFKITTAGGYDFIPNVILDGERGEISGDKVVAANIRTKIKLVYSSSPSEIAEILGNGYSINLSDTGTHPVDYTWYTIYLPDDRNMAGTILTIHAPMSSVKRYKIKTSNPNGLFYVNEPVKVLSELQIVQGVRGTIEMKAVWDELNGTLDWHVLSQVSYMVNYVQPTVLRVPPYFKPNELVYRGTCSSAVALTKKYQSIISNVTAVKESSGSAWARIEVTMPTYYGPTGSILQRTAFNSSYVLRLEVTSVSGGRTVYVYPSYTPNNVWMFNVTLYDNSGTAVHEPFDFNIYTNDYFIQSQWMDNKLDGN